MRGERRQKKGESERRGRRMTSVKSPSAIPENLNILFSTDAQSTTESKYECHMTQSHTHHPRPVTSQEVSAWETLIYETQEEHQKPTNP